MKKKILAIALSIGSTLAAVASEKQDAIDKMMGSVRPEAIRAHLKFLAHDLLEGRGIGQRGGDLAALYIAAQFERMGLEPAGENGSYLQKVPLVGVETSPESKLEIAAGDRRLELKLYDDYMLWTERQEPEVRSEGELVFVGYGIEAPEYNWDDYKGTDVAGKIIVMLVNDPPSTDPKFFGGPGLTYYGRWTYKFEIANRKGARGALLIHTAESAGYGWEVVRNSWGREQPYVALEPGARALDLAGWITERKAKELFALSGQDLDLLRRKAAGRDFRPVALGARASAAILSKIRQIETYNVIGILRGRDSELRDEAVIYTAHYDHLGIGMASDGDNIFNGAVDNASGTATLLEIAEAFARGARPRRSLLFAALTAEEGGLRGSEYYVKRPTVPASKIAANINLDVVSVLGETESFTLLGAERSTLEQMAERAAAKLKFKIVPDENPEQGFFYRSDQFNFAKAGIPAIGLKPGLDYKGRPKEWGRQQFLEYRDKRYHRPGDEYQPDWDLSGAAQIGRIAMLIGWYAAESDQMPAWKPGDEFAKGRR